MGNGGPGFRLDRDATIRVIADRWDLDPGDRDAWWIGAFGNGLADSVEMLSRVVFSPRLGLLGGPALEILVLPVLPDSPAHPVMVGVVAGNGPIVCRGIEDLAESLPDPFGHGPGHVLDALEALLEIASGLVPDVERTADSAFEPFPPQVTQEARLLSL